MKERTKQRGPSLHDYPRTEEGEKQWRLEYNRWYHRVNHAKRLKQQAEYRRKNSANLKKQLAKDNVKKREETEMENGYSIETFMATPASKLPKVISRIMCGAAFASIVR